MKRKRYTDEQIAYALRQAEAGTPIKEVCPQAGRQRADVVHVAPQVRRDGRGRTSGATTTPP